MVSNKIIFEIGLRLKIFPWLCFFLLLRNASWSWSCTNFSYCLLIVLRLIVSCRLRGILRLLRIWLLRLIVNRLLSICLLLRVPILLRVLRILLWIPLIGSIIWLLRIIISKTIHKVCNLRCLATHSSCNF